MGQSRTPAWIIVLRTFVFVFLSCCAMALLFNWSAGRNVVKLPEMLGASACIVGAWVVLGLFVVGFGAKLLFGSNPDYQRWIGKGGRPYWDSNPFNPDSDGTNGFAEPPAEGVPPREIGDRQRHHWNKAWRTFSSEEVSIPPSEFAPGEIVFQGRFGPPRMNWRCVMRSDGFDETPSF